MSSDTAMHAHLHPNIHTAIVTSPEAMQAFCEASTPAAAGAVVTFHGVVRNHDQGRQVTTLEYVGHPTADAVLQSVTAQVMGAHPDALTVRVAHRVGTLAVGDAAFFVAVTAAHRGSAFALCSALVDEVKHLLPVWKRQVFSDGTEEWVNSP